MALINELNCKTMDRQDRLRQRRAYERARRYAETAEQKELRLSRRREADRARRAARNAEQREALLQQRRNINRKYDDNCQRAGKLTGLGVLLMT